MSDRTDPQRVIHALESLADTFAAHALPPPAAGLRARATRRLRLRRTTTALTAAAAVAALAIGGAHAIDLAVPPPVPPAVTPTGEPSPSTGPSPTPPPVPPVTPSPRPAPLAPQAPPDDPITQVDWREVTITLPPHEVCPSGRVRFTPFGEPDGYPRAESGGKAMELYPDDSGLLPRIAYGDVTGDGQLEVVIAVQCFFSDGEAGPTGHGGHLLVVGRSGGALSGLGWVGPYSSDIHEVWVAGDGRVLMVGDPWTVNPEDHFPAIPGLVLSYRWDGARFVGWEPAPEYPPIVPLDPSGVGPLVRPRAVASGLGCPDVELRFTRPGDGWGGTATAAGASFVIATGSFQQYLFDLDHTGDRLLVVAMACTGPDGWTREGLAVFERAGDGWQGISVLPPPPGLGLVDAGDWVIDADSAFVVRWARQVGEGSWDSFPVRYRWTGTVFEVVQ